MRRKRMRAFLITLLFYALAGPLVGLLSLFVFSFLMEAWGPVTDRLGALISHLQSSPCDARFDPAHIDLRCFQRHEPRPFPYPSPNLRMASLAVVGTYMIGLVPALLAGLLICVGALRDRGVGFGYVVAVGMLIGFMTGVMAIFRPESAILLFFICLIATIVCWRATRRLWPKPEIATADSAR
jgi:hypothetical protein